MTRYNPTEIEPKWQQQWAADRLYVTQEDTTKQKFVLLTEFPYPSGDGLHLGHTREYTLGDILARHKRMQGYNVLYPMGYDAFGLPTENYAIKHKIRPQDATEQNVSNFQKQFERLGFSIDWSRSFRTSDPDYYRWTQWLFVQFFKHGLAYQDDISINWCPKCKTGLANEEVVNGVHERCDTPVEKKQLRQWMLAITKYADKLIDNLKELDYPSRIADQQVNWIGKSVGAEVEFAIAQDESRVKSHEARDSLKFTPELTRMIVDGKKTSTIRLEPKNLQVGDWVEFMTRAGEEVTPFGYAKITKIRTLALSDIPNDLPGHQPMLSDEQKLAQYKGYYDDTVTLNTNFTIYDFEFDHDSCLMTRNSIKVFTTRPDTLYGATFMVLAPEHELVGAITTDEQRGAVEAYVQAAAAKTDIERQENKEKTGVFTGAYALNPLTDEKTPVWVADYVLMGYGTGAIMAVPAHDERDGEFARKFDIPIKEVVAPDFGTPLPEAVDVQGPVVIGYDPTTKQYMSLLNKNNDMVWFAAGGLNDGETFEQAALRELAEEAGYHEVKQLVRLGGPTYSYYFNSNKQSNRRSFSYMFIAILDSTETIQQAQESHENYEIVWSDYDALKDGLQKEQDEIGDVGHWLDGLERAKNAVAAYEAGEEYVGPTLTGDGVLFDSGPYSGLNSAEARELIVQHLEREGKGKERINFRLRDWIFSRQHYWGEPIPIIHCPKHGAVPVPDDQLPVTLPDVEHYEPTDTGESPLAAITDWVNTTCPTCGEPAKRETDTMPNWAGSSWYYLRYYDAHNDQAFADPDKLKYWGAVDLYLGGMEHTTLHLLYSRFWHEFFYDIGLVPTPEPYIARRGQGIILAQDGRKMSKSLGNVTNPMEIVDAGYGADALRLAIAFIAPYDQTTPWDPKGVAGTHRFLSRVWALVEESKTAGETGDVPRNLVHKVIKKVSDDLTRMSFNTAIAALMEYVNELYKRKTAGMGGENWQFALETLVKLVAPFAPHIAEELWGELGGNGSVHVAPWPHYDEALLVEATVTVVVQINGKVRATIDVPAEVTKEELERLALDNNRVKELLGDKKPTRAIIIPGRLVNLVV